MAAPITDISDFTQAEVQAFDAYVRQSLKFIDTSEEQAAKTILLQAACNSVARKG